MGRFAPSFALFFVVALASSTAFAQSPPLSTDFDEEAGGDTQARASFDAGRAALEAGRTEEALADFQEAYRLSGRGELLYNIGMVQERLHHDRPALEAFERYLDAVPDASNRASVEDRIRTLREEIARDDAVAAALSHTAAQDERGDDVFASPIFWVIVGVVVVGAAVGIGLGVGLSQDPGTAPATPGPSGVVISALRF
jgi:tetratricopeptide (TPR) repeat protein